MKLTANRLLLKERNGASQRKTMPNATGNPTSPLINTDLNCVKLSASVTSMANKTKKPSIKALITSTPTRITRWTSLDLKAEPSRRS